MDHPLHLFRLSPAPTSRDSETIRIATRDDAPWHAAIFRAPALPTLRQLYSEIPFSVNLRLKKRARR